MLFLNFWPKLHTPYEQYFITQLTEWVKKMNTQTRSGGQPIICSLKEHDPPPGIRNLKEISHNPPLILVWKASNGTMMSVTGDWNLDFKETRHFFSLPRLFFLLVQCKKAFHFLLFICFAILLLFYLYYPPLRYVQCSWHTYICACTVPGEPLTQLWLNIQLRFPILFFSMQYLLLIYISWFIIPISLILNYTRGGGSMLLTYFFIYSHPGVQGHSQWFAFYLWVVIQPPLGSSLGC